MIIILPSMCTLTIHETERNHTKMEFDIGDYHNNSVYLSQYTSKPERRSVLQHPVPHLPQQRTPRHIASPKFQWKGSPMSSQDKTGCNRTSCLVVTVMYVCAAVVSVAVSLAVVLSGSSTMVKVRCDHTCSCIAENTHENKQCQFGFTPWNGHCYLYESSHFTWYAAEAFCAGYNASLLYIETAEEQAQIVKFIHKLPSLSVPVGYWTGGNDQTSEDTWWWSGTNLLMDYTNWDEGEPSDHENDEDCMGMQKHIGCKWNDIICSGDDLGAICKYKLK